MTTLELIAMFDEFPASLKGCKPEGATFWQSVRVRVLGKINGDDNARKA